MLTTQEALVGLATTTAGAAVEALRSFAPEHVGAGPVSVALPGRDPLAGVELPAIVAEGAGAFFVVPLAPARRLAAAARGLPTDDVVDSEDLTEADLDALREVGARVAAAIGAATAAALGIEEPAGDVDVRVAQSARDVKIGFQGATRATLAVVSIFGESCRLVQLVPAELAMHIAQAGDQSGAPADGGLRDALGAVLRDVPLRVWAEVGRARLRSAEVASLGDGAIVELDRAADDPVDLYVNGSRIGTGRLICIDGKEWAVRLEEVFAVAEADAAEVPTS